MHRWHLVLYFSFTFCKSPVVNNLKRHINQQAVAEKIDVLKKKLTEGDFSALKEIRETVLQLNAPPKLVCSF